mmetsp:Transcript_38504/g.86458  ORF Transcript_38504/g.86458 Transcript_38504/m.86458 type:complete len:485 (-) Transcript_38504:788-2242(-)
MIFMQYFTPKAQGEPHADHDAALAMNCLDYYSVFLQEFDWRTAVDSGWGGIIFTFLFALQSHYTKSFELECGEYWEIVSGKQVSEVYEYIQIFRNSGQLNDELRKACPHAFATMMITVAALDVAMDSDGKVDSDLAADVRAAAHDAVVDLQLSMALHAGRHQNFFQVIGGRWPLWFWAAQLAQHLADPSRFDSHVRSRAQRCPIFCPAATPNSATCSCDVLFPRVKVQPRVCIFMVDTRPGLLQRSFASIAESSFSFYAAARHVNQLYAAEHGYNLTYVRPIPEKHYPGRKVGWAKVRIVIDELTARPDCDLGVSVDTDAFLRSSESIGGWAAAYDLTPSSEKHILFGKELHDELGSTIVNGGFFVVKNTETGRRILEEWWRVPLDHPSHAHFLREDPQGLNKCWDQVVHPRWSAAVAVGSATLFSAPLSTVVRHNWFKDRKFVQEMTEVIAARLQHQFGCIICNEWIPWEQLGVDASEIAARA